MQERSESVHECTSDADGHGVEPESLSRERRAPRFRALAPCVVERAGKIAFRSGERTSFWMHARPESLASPREGGFYLQYTQMPAGFEVPLHSHDHDELRMVLSGSCGIGPDVGEESVELGPRDSVALAGGPP